MSIINVTGEGVIWIEQDKDARLNYEFKLDSVMAPTDSIAGVTWSIAPSDVAVSDVTWADRNIFTVLSGGVANTWYALKLKWTSAAGLSDEFVVRVFIIEDEEQQVSLGSNLFPNRFSATAELRRDRLLAAAAVLPNAQFSDDYLWQKIQAAEADLAHRLRVPLVPTQFFPDDPPAQADIDALNGMPWDIDPGYDLGPDNYMGDRWGMISLRNAPLLSIQRYRFAYPAINGLHYDVPLEWLRPDKKRGLINVVPASFSISVPLSTIVMQALAGGRTVPLMLQVTYQAGLANVQRDYPDLLDLVKKMAVLRCIEDSFVPQSGSISADGLSQSMSIDMEKYRDTIEFAINGPKGSNGGLMTAIHGVRGLVF